MANCAKEFLSKDRGFELQTTSHPILVHILVQSPKVSTEGEKYGKSLVSIERTHNVHKTLSLYI